MDRRDFIASAIVSAIAAPVVTRLRPEVSTNYLSLYCVWFDGLYLAATRDYPQRDWELYLAYYVEGIERSVPMPLPLREALLLCGLGSELPQSDTHTLIIRSTLTPDEVIGRCERVMATWPC